MVMVIVIGIKMIMTTNFSHHHRSCKQNAENQIKGLQSQIEELLQQLEQEARSRAKAEKGKSEMEKKLTELDDQLQECVPKDEMEQAIRYLSFTTKH